MYWLYDVPEWLLAPLVVAVIVALSLGGFVAARRVLPPQTNAENDVAAAVLATIGVVYGILLALIAVAAWNNYTDAGDATAREADALADMFRQFGGYPEPAQQRLRARVRDYVDVVLSEEWAAVQHQRVSERAMRLRDALAREWAGFEPRTERDRVLHDATGRELTAFLDARRARLASGRAGLPAPLWTVVVLGALITIGCTYFLRVEDERVQLLMISALAATLGLVIFLILALDHPLWGTQGLTPDAFLQVAPVIRGQ
jgi:Protein of unknown function (DUF4239)